VNILCIADVENKGLWDYYTPEKMEDVDLIISCGDLNSDYLQYLVTMANKPLLYVPGNHDAAYDRKPPLGCENIDGKIYDFKGLRILGLGGSMKYHEGPNMYTEGEMARKIRKMNSAITLRNGFDILVTHAPAAGHGDLEDLPHQGFKCFNQLIEKWQPKYMLHGHVHANYNPGSFERETMHETGTKIINCYDKYLLSVEDSEHPPLGKTGSALYDLYVNMKEQQKRKYYRV
jgi:Icc-related predicted phosphoesterase